MIHLVDWDEIPELPMHGDKESNDSIRTVLEQHLPDSVEFAGVAWTAWNDPSLDGGPTIVISCLPREAIAYLLNTMAEYQGGLLFKGSPDLAPILDPLHEMGRYPKSESSDDDFFVSFSYTIHRYPERDFTYFEYWFDDSTR